MDRHLETAPGFWLGYAAWLKSNRLVLVLLTLVLAALFLGGLWVSATPEDPFRYEIY